MKPEEESKKKKVGPRLYYPHGKVHKGVLAYDRGAGKKVARFSRSASIDLTGSVFVGRYTWIGNHVKIYTHDHYFDSVLPIRMTQKMMGVKWKDKTIGNDVWLSECIILMNVTEIPDGVVIGAGSVLTKNPGPYEIWAGNPARKIGSRKKEAV